MLHPQIMAQEVDDPMREVALTLRKRCLEFLQRVPGDPYIKKASIACAELIKSQANSEDSSSVSDWIKKYCQACLDVTFFEENILVQSEFPEPGGMNHMNDIIECLGSAEKCLTTIYKDDPDQIKKMLGEELIECVHWRKGALNYMYCATLMEKPERVTECHERFLQACREGIDQLKFMLNVRKPLEETRQQVSTNDEAAFELLKNGIFSDTHMLALVYCGELCMWCVKECGDKGCISSKKSIGIETLTLYIAMATGPLKERGWSADQAKSYMEQLEKVY